MHHSGEVYGQEATSTLPIESLRAVAEQTFGDQPLCVLDLCAAPGSKASQVASQLHIDLLVANEPQKTRAALLQANLLRAGVSEALILSMDGTRIGAIMPNAFDVVLVDARGPEGPVQHDLERSFVVIHLGRISKMEEIHHHELLSDIIFAATQRFRCAQEKSQQASDQTLDSEGWRHKTHPNSPRPSPRRAASGLSREASRDLEYEEYEPENEGLGAVFGQNEAEGKSFASME
eukprot:g28993.t1